MLRHRFADITSCVGRKRSAAASKRQLHVELRRVQLATHRDQALSGWLPKPPITESVPTSQSEHSGKWSRRLMWTKGR
eukprot:1032645-Rhodomonas_salina.3